jgi:hypothetical protein
MVSIININNGIKELTHGYQNYNTSETLIFDGNLKMREFLYISELISESKPF